MTTDASHLVLIEENAKLATAILSRIKPVNRFVSIAQVVQPDRVDIEFRKREPVPIFLHLGDGGKKVIFLRRLQPRTNPAYFDLWAFRIVIGRDVGINAGGIDLWLRGLQRDQCEAYRDQCK